MAPFFVPQCKGHAVHYGLKNVSWAKSAHKFAWITNLKPAVLPQTHGGGELEP